MDFKDKIDEAHINAEKLRFEAPKPAKSWKDKVLQLLSKSWLLLIVGAAAIAITVLHFKGKDILQTIRLTPLPSFGWEESIQPKALPDKTEVYKEALKKEEKDRRQEFSQQAKGAAKSKITRPDWKMIKQRSLPKTDSVQKIDSIQRESIQPKSLAADTLKKVNSPSRKIKMKRKRKEVTTETPKEKKTEVLTTEDMNKADSQNFFQAVKVNLANTSTQSFTACVIHGDQELGNNDMLSLRLTESLSIKGQTFPAGTIFYGSARIAQSRILVTVSRILQTPVHLQVHHHTFHEGILLDESQSLLEEAGQQTLYRQGQRSVRDIPLDIAAELGRNVLQRSRRKQTTVFLPDGLPLFVSQILNDQ
ncbi:conjugative transposon protein TraM [Catalinimonas sp. 4WD22]|uniref:conjugative transposon protein TraM n=1 Tax=Catalinimonas locisalis TaxID=3133978 RepID=UPI003101AE78